MIWQQRRRQQGPEKPSKNYSAVKRLLRLSALAFLLAATAVASAEMRTWNLKSGATLEAEIVAFPGPDTVQVKRSDGKMANLPAAYLTDADRAYLDAERAKQWKEVSIDKVLGTVSAGRYKKCAVSGKEVGHEILVALLPSQVEAVVNNRQQQEAQIANLSSRITEDSTAARNANDTAATSGNRADRNANRAQAKLAKQDEAAAKAYLARLKADYAEYVKKTKATTTVRMKNTGLVYDGLSVWECQVSPKRP
jgi:hypothetical protein